MIAWSCSKNKRNGKGQAILTFDEFVVRQKQEEAKRIEEKARVANKDTSKVEEIDESKGSQDCGRFRGFLE